MKILVVDDDLTSRNYLKEVLEKYGDIHMACDGVEAINSVKKGMMEDEPYNVIFLDIMMPRMNGYETLNTIRELEEKKNIPQKSQSKIIMMTAASDGESSTGSFSKGREYYLLKPVSPEEIVKVWFFFILSE